MSKRLGKAGHPVTRRDFVKTSIAAAAAVPFSTVGADKSVHDYDVIVIGDGFAGATTADQEHGCRTGTGIDYAAEHQLAYVDNEVRIDRPLGFVHPRNMDRALGMADE